MNPVESPSIPVAALVPNAQWTWKTVSTQDADVILSIQITGPNIPAANVQLPLKRSDTTTGPSWVTTSSIILDDAPWDSVCKGGRRTITFTGVSTNGIAICVTRTWGPGSLRVTEKKPVEVTGARDYCILVDMAINARSVEPSTITVPYSQTSTGRTDKFTFIATWSNRENK